VATLSYYLVERPGRRIGVHGRPDRLPARPPRRGRNLATTTAGAFALAAVFVGLLSAIDPERSTAIPVNAATISQPASQSLTLAGAEGKPAEETPYARTLRSWQQEIRAGLGRRQLPPSLRPLSPHLSMAFPPPCIRDLPGVAAGECVVGNPAAAHVAVLTGDSHAEMLRNAVWRAFDPATWSIHIFASYGCGWAGSAEDGTVSATTCRRLQAGVLERIRTLRPDVLLLSEHRVVTEFRSRADIASSLAAFRRAATKTIVIGHTPPARPWSSCLLGSDITACFASLDETYVSDVRVEQQLATRAGATFVDSSAWLCVPAGTQTVCPPLIDGVPVFKDDDHVGAEYQLKLSPIVRALLITAGVPVGGQAS
jgi:hypothetical protein